MILASTEDVQSQLGLMERHRDSIAGGPRAAAAISDDTPRTGLRRGNIDDCAGR